MASNARTDLDQHPASEVDERRPSTALRQLEFLATSSLTPDPRNPRKHGRAQIRAIAGSIEEYGFTQPILIDTNRQIIAGHGRYEAAQFLGLALVPVICLDGLTETQTKGLLLADNQLAHRSSWDDPKVAILLKELSDPILNFDIEATGFELPEIDIRIQSLDGSDAADRADEFNVAAGPAGCRPECGWNSVWRVLRVT